MSGMSLEQIEIRWKLIKRSKFMEMKWVFMEYIKLWWIEKKGWYLIKASNREMKGRKSKSILKIYVLYEAKKITEIDLQ